VRKQKEAGKVLLTIVLPASLVQSFQRTCYYVSMMIRISQEHVGERREKFCLSRNTHW